MRAILDHVLVEALDNGEIQSVGGAILESREGKPEKGKVVSVGKGRVLESGTREPMDVKVNEIILFMRYATDEVKHEDKTLYSLKQSQILAIID